MGRFKCISENYILGIGINQSPADEITQEEYDLLANKFHNVPTAPYGYRYMLRADTLEWELVEIQPEPDNDPIEPDDNPIEPEDAE